MKTVEFWCWWLTDQRTGRRYRSRWSMTAEQAAEYGATERVQGTCERREVAEPGEYRPSQSTPAGMTKPDDLS